MLPSRLLVSLGTLVFSRWARLVFVIGIMTPVSLSAFWSESAAHAAPVSPLAPPPPPAAAIKDNQESVESPRYMIRQFLEVINRNDIDGAFNLVEFPRHRMSSERKRKLVRQLINVLNRKGRIEVASISNLAEGKPSDSNQLDVEVIGRVVMQDEIVPVTLLRVEDGASKFWRFTPEFMEQVPRLAEKLEQSDIESTLPPSLVQNQLFGVKIWQMLGLGLSMILAWLLSGGLALAILKLLGWLGRRFKIDLTDESLRGFLQPLRMLAVLLAFRFTVNLVELSLAVKQSIFDIGAVLAVLVLTFLALRASESLIELIKFSFERQGRQGSVAMLPPAQKATKIFIVVVAIVFLLRDLGFDVTAIVAGLGVGGLAIALAGQKTIENLFGGISVILDQPVRVGDSGRFGDIIGAVEDIGLRSTRVRTLDRTIVTIPNAEFSHMKLENFEKRDKIRWNVTLLIRFETSAEQMQLLLIQLKELLIAHPMVHNEPARARFVRIGPAALEVEIFTYIRTTDWNEYLAVIEDINLRMLRIVIDCGTNFAFPGSAVYSVRGDVINAEMQQLATEKMQDLQRSGALPLPYYPPEWVESRADTLNFGPAEKS